MASALDPPLRRGADLAGRDLRGADLRGADLRRADLSRADLRGADLAGARVAHADFTRATLDAADLRHADFTGARFERASLRRAALSGSRITGARLIRADLTEARLTGARLAGSDLSGAVLRGVVAVGARFAGCRLVGVDLDGARLNDADLRQTHLTHATLRGADLSGADLRDADLRRARLQRACLAGVDARWACFDGAGLDGADLRDADLRWAHLDRITAPGADLRRADLHRAWLCGDLVGARFDHAGLGHAWLGGCADGARFDRADLRGLWPVGLHLADGCAPGARVDANGLEALAARQVSGPLIVDLPQPPGGRLLHWPQRATNRVEVPDEAPWQGAGLAIPLPGPRLTIGPRPPRHRPPRWTGIDAFDDAVAIDPPDPVDTLARLDHALRGALLLWIGWGGTVEHSALRIDTLGPVSPRADRLIAALRITRALARPLPDPDAALMARLPAERTRTRRRLLARWMVAGDRPRVPSSSEVSPSDREGALRDLVVHGPARAWAVVELAGRALRQGPIVAEGADLTGITLGTLRLDDGRFAGACLAGADLTRAEARRIDLRGADLRGARMGRALLVDADLRGACLDGAQLVEARLSGADLRGADLSGADLRDADLSGARLDGCNAPYARFVGARLDGARFDRCTAPGARFIRATGEHISFTGARLSRATYDRARLSAVSWIGCDLQRARFRRARLSRVSLAGAETRLAVFDDAHLEDAVLTGCHVDGGAVGARLERVDLRRATIAGELDRAELDRVDLRGARIEPESLRRLCLRAIRIELSGIAGLLAARGETIRPGPVRGVTADGRHGFCWRRDPAPRLTLWRRAHGVASDDMDDMADGAADGAPNNILDDTLGGILRDIDRTCAAIGHHFDTPAGVMPAEDDSAAARAGPAGVRIPWAPVDLTLSREGALSTVRKALGGPEPQVGDPAFDSAVFVACDDPAALHARLDPPLRAELRRWVLDGGALSGGVLGCPGVIDRARVVPTLRRALAIVAGLTAPLADRCAALWRRVTLDPLPGVRAAALCYWMRGSDGLRLPAEPGNLPPGTLEPALLRLLDSEAATSQARQVVAWLGVWGTEAAVPALAALGGRWRTPQALKAAVDRAIADITRRQGGLRSGGLSISSGDMDGRVSPVIADDG